MTKPPLPEAGSSTATDVLSRSDDDLKLPLNTLLAWVVLSQVPSVWFWPGALLIVAASSFVYWSESNGRRATLAAA